MTSLLEWTSPDALLARGRSLIAGALRAAAGALQSLADALAPRDAAAPSAEGSSAALEAPLPGAGTRERIAEALQRARSSYDAAGARPARTRRRR